MFLFARLTKLCHVVLRLGLCIEQSLPQQLEEEEEEEEEKHDIHPVLQAFMEQLYMPFNGEPCLGVSSFLQDLYDEYQWNCSQEKCWSKFVKLFIVKTHCIIRSSVT